MRVSEGHSPSSRLKERQHLAKLPRIPLGGHQRAKIDFLDSVLFQGMAAIVMPKLDAINDTNVVYVGTIRFIKSHGGSVLFGFSADEVIESFPTRLLVEHVVMFGIDLAGMPTIAPESCTTRI